ncbi:MAG: DUF4115 domain-containing protein [Caldilineaceae bacterium]|nr:DUF4115 domain-containing protein [Caldilineaceae bacterium]
MSFPHSLGSTHPVRRPLIFISPVVVTALLCAFLFGALGQAVAAPRFQEDTHTLSVNALQTSWIEATVDGQRRYYGMMNAGAQESWTGASIILLIGNAGGVEVTADGRFLGTLGQPRQVITLRWPEDAGRYAVQNADTVSPTPSPTAMPSPTPSPTVMPSPTATPTETSLPTAVASPTPTVSETPARTAASERNAIASFLEQILSAAAKAAESAEDVEVDEVTIAEDEAVDEESAETETDADEVEVRTHVVQPGDTLGQIAIQYGVDVESLQAANSLDNPNLLAIGWTLVIPNEDGSVPDGASPIFAVAGAPTPPGAPIQARGTITERMTINARQMSEDSPFYGQTWLTYYGRPNVPIMGILGEFDVDELTVRLQEQADAYDEANGPYLGVKPAFHLVYGMATRAPGDGSYLGFMTDGAVMTYISKALELDYGVILDVQIGALTPAQSITPALRYLHYGNVHLAIDPEFAMIRPGQAVPGNPIGFVTAEQVNETQAVIQQYMEENDIPGPVILLVHQFQDSMIQNKDQIDSSYDRVALTLSVDGWGGPWGKISKYNSLVNENTPFISFKLFYRWDEPLLNERQALGEEPYPNIGYMEITPNMIIYQ